MGLQRHVHDHDGPHADDVHLRGDDLRASELGVRRRVHQEPRDRRGVGRLGPFYTQTYGAFFGVDGSTLEMCSNQVCGGRFGSKRAQYLGFYSSALFWIDNRNEILHDQLEIFRRGVTSAARPDCCGDPVIAGLGFTEDEHNWMVDYPQAFVIPEGGSPGGHPPSRSRTVSAARPRRTGSRSGCSTTASSSIGRRRATRTASRRSRGTRTWCLWTSSSADRVHHALPRARTSRNGSRSCTRRPARGATDSSGAPTRSRCPPTTRSRRRWNRSRR